MLTKQLKMGKTVIECDSIQHAMEELRFHEIETNNRYAAYKTSKNFGHNCIQNGKKVFWEDQPSVILGRQEFCGIPFMVLGNKVLDCQFGKERHLKAKEKRNRLKKMKKMNGHGYKRGKKFLVQPSRKISCPARCVLRELYRFPSYKVSLDSSVDERKRISEEILEKVKAGENVCAEKVIIAVIPEEHTCHKVGEIPPEPIDFRVSKKIKQMCAAGVKDMEGMKKIIRNYVSEICQPLPYESCQRFSNHMYSAIKENSLDDQQSLIELVKEWQYFAV